MGKQPTPTLTPTAARALDIMVKRGPIRQDEFGCAMWPHLAMSRCMGCAGSYLGRLSQRKLIRYVSHLGYKITGLGLRALGAHEGEGPI